MLDVLSIAIDTGVYSQGKVLNNFFAKLYVHTIGKAGHRLFKSARYSDIIKSAFAELVKYHIFSVFMISRISLFLLLPS